MGFSFFFFSWTTDFLSLHLCRGTLRFLHWYPGLKGCRPTPRKPPNLPGGRIYLWVFYGTTGGSVGEKWIRSNPWYRLSKWRVCRGYKETRERQSSPATLTKTGDPTLVFTTQLSPDFGNSRSSVGRSRESVLAPLPLLIHKIYHIEMDSIVSKLLGP